MPIIGDRRFKLGGGSVQDPGSVLLKVRHLWRVLVGIRKETIYCARLKNPM